MLTRRQAELFRYLAAFEMRNGYCPSFDEMKDALSIKSKSGIHKLITGLEERGFIHRLHHRARAITTKVNFVTHCPHCDRPISQAAEARLKSPGVGI